MNKILYILFAALLATTSINSQWTWLNPTPQGNYLVQTLMLNNGTIIASGNHGTMNVSTDNGNSWIVTHKVHDTSSVIISLCRLSDNLIFAGSTDSRILRSTNSGINWTVISKVIPQNTYLIQLFFVDAVTGFANFGYNVYKTTNGGLNWNFASLFQQQCNDIFFVNANTGFAGGGAIVDSRLLSWAYKSTNGGLNWQSMSLADTGPVSKLQFLNPNTGYYSGWNSLFKTTNSGSNWFAINYTGPVSRINFFHFFDENTAYVGTNGSNFQTTTNGGANWNSISLPYYTFNSHSGINTFSFTNTQNGCLLLNEHSVLKTSNAGSNWSLLTNSFNQYTPLKAIEFLDNNTAILGGWGTTNDHIIYKSTNAAINWSGKYLSDYQNSTGYIYDIDFPSLLTGYAVGGRSGKGYVYKSTNSGNNWIKMDSIGTNQISKCFFLDVNTGFAVGSFSMIYKTTNGAASWSSYPVSANSLNSVVFTDSQTGYACGSNSPQVVLKTTNAGANWTQVFSATGSSFLNLYFTSGTTGFLAAKGIYKTTDAGQSWIQKLPANQIYFMQVFFPSANTGYAASQFGRLFKSTDAGENWGELSSPTDYPIADIYFLNDNTGYFVGDQGMILKTTNGGGNFVIGISQNEMQAPVNFRLMQNYPNPFNPVTVIGFEIFESSSAKVTVFDVTGKEIKVLIDGFISSGSYNVEWNAENYASGVYFYELRAGEFNERKKMVLVK